MPKGVTAYHTPVGDPCEKCGEEAGKHRVNHVHVGQGEACERCGCRRAMHKSPKELKSKPWKERNITETMREGSRHRARLQAQAKRHAFVGIDGEGIGRDVHKYVYLAVSDRWGSFRDSIEKPTGLRTVECLEFLLRLPEDVRPMAFAFGYDLTKMLEDIDDETLYALVRPDMRRQNDPERPWLGPKPVKWRNYLLNLQGTKFTVQKYKKSVVVWDVFKFYQTSFVVALESWKVGSPELHARMAAMKDQRDEFDKLYVDNAKKVHDYCLEECACMAELADRLTDAHDAVELKLTGYYGAGSTGSAMLTKMGILDKLRPMPAAMREPVAVAFAGGRFENSVLGLIKANKQEPLYSADISSAYPYQCTRLPCLIHGEWKHTKSETRIAEWKGIMLVHYGLGRSRRAEAWAPFPYRVGENTRKEKKGSSFFPIESPGGWVWGEEFRQGVSAFGNAYAKEAWLYIPECDCRPFKDVPRYYIERLAIGKEGPGIVLKLGLNSAYGKLAQSVGNARFNSWAWAGMITSGCRAQMLEVMALHEDKSNILMIATDGLITRENIVYPLPWDTGTDIDVTERATGKVTRKPLGGFEVKKIIKPMFFARPGIYFQCNDENEHAGEIAKMRARGIGRKTLFKNWRKVVNGYRREGIEGVVKLDNVVRFCGIKASITRAPNPDGTWRYRRAERRKKDREGHDLPVYGQWIKRPVEMRFNPLPKRNGLHDDGISLRVRKVKSGHESAPYEKAMREEPDKDSLEELLESVEDQPDLEFGAYEE